LRGNSSFDLSPKQGVALAQGIFRIQIALTGL